MPQFRTIEQFVQLCDERSDFFKVIASGGLSNEWSRGYVAAYKQIAQILRTSNIGIVHSPTGESDVRPT